MPSRIPCLAWGPINSRWRLPGDAAKEVGRGPIGWEPTTPTLKWPVSADLPAFLLYVAVIAVTLASNFRIFRRTAHLAEYQDLAALALCFFSATLAYAICTFFFHIAYSSYLPSIAGMSVALRLATCPPLWRSRAQGIGTSSSGGALCPIAISACGHFLTRTAWLLPSSP